MANDGRILIYFDELVMRLLKAFRATMDTHIYSPRDILDSMQGIKPVNAIEIPDCNKCAFNEGIAHWHQCENCLGQARNNFVPISEVSDG